jgi:hypothetical protein
MACGANSMRHQGRKPIFLESLKVAAEQAAKKVIYVVIPSEARNLSSIETQGKRDSSARSVPRNDKLLGFSAASETATHKDRPELGPDLPPQPQIEFPDHARNYHGR